MYELKTFITDAGLAIINHLAITGQSLEVTGAKVGSGKLVYSNEAERATLAIALTDLIAFERAGHISRSIFEDGSYLISFQVHNEDLQNPIHVQEAAVYCKDVINNGGDVMLCYLDFGDYPDWVLSGEIPLYFRQFDVVLRVGNVQADIEVSPSALVTFADYQQHLQDKANPHAVKADQVLLSGGGESVEAALVKKLEVSVYTALNILEKLKTVDGANSGLDADLFKGNSIIQVPNGGSGLATSPSLQTNLSSTAAANVMQASPRPGVTGVLAIGNGGSGLNASPSLQTNLASTAAANAFQASPRPGVTGILQAGNGGTGFNNLQAARNAMGLGNTLGAVPAASGGFGVDMSTAANQNTGFNNAGLRIAHGTFTFLASTSGVSSRSLVFPIGRFTAAPTVIAIPITTFPQHFDISVSESTATSVLFYINNNYGAGVYIPIYWIAIQTSWI